MDLTAARLALQQAHPNIFVAGSPENLAFVAHAKEFGEESAHQNADKLMSPFMVKSPAGGRSGSPGAASDALAQAQQAADFAKKPLAERAGADIRGAGQAIASVPGMLSKGVNAVDRAASQFASGITGQPQDIHPTEHSLATLKDEAGKTWDTTKQEAQGVGNAIKSGVQTVKNWLSPPTQTADEENKKQQPTY
jgi:hypothetical protein